MRSHPTTVHLEGVVNAEEGGNRRGRSRREGGWSVCVRVCVCVLCVDACVCDPTLSGLVCLVTQCSVLMVSEY